MTFEEMTVGLKFRTAARTVTETDLVNFVTLCGFNEPLFWDARHAKSAGYEGRLIPGALIYAIAEGLVLQTHALHGTGLAFMQMELQVLRPVFVGDTLDCVVEITESRPSSKPGRGVVTSRNRVFNQSGEEVLVYTPVRLIRGKDFA
jgi:acyl dehydratase